MWLIIQVVHVQYDRCPVLCTILYIGIHITYVGKLLCISIRNHSTTCYNNYTECGITCPIRNTTTMTVTPNIQTAHVHMYMYKTVHN